MPGRIRKTPEEIYEMAQQEDITFLDVIDEHSYADFDQQIAGAIRIKPSQVGDQFTKLPPEKKVAIY